MREILSRGAIDVTTDFGRDVLERQIQLSERVEQDNWIMAERGALWQWVESRYGHLPRENPGTYMDLFRKATPDLRDYYRILWRLPEGDVFLP